MQNLLQIVVLRFPIKEKHQKQRVLVGLLLWGDESIKKERNNSYQLPLLDCWTLRKNLVKSDQVREQGDPALVGVDARYVGNLQLVEHVA